MAAQHKCHPLTHTPHNGSNVCPEAQTEKENALCTLLEDEVKLRRFTDTVLDSRQSELESTQTQLALMIERVKELEERLAHRNPAAAAGPSTFAHGPWQRSDDAETTVKAAYSELCCDVWKWVENKIGSRAFGGGHSRIKATTQQAYRFTSLLRDLGRSCIDASQTDEYHVYAAIMNYLWHALFTRSFYAPLDDTENNSMQKWLDNMSKTIAEQQDIRASRVWRSDTLLGMTKQPSFKGIRLRYLDAVADDLSFILATLASNGDKSKIQASVRKELVEPAAQFAHQMHTSPAIFSLKWPARQPWTRLENYECTNLASPGQKIDFAGTNQSSESRRGVTYMFDLAPGLFVERIEGVEKLGPKAIGRPQVLVLHCQGQWPKGKTMTRVLWDISENGGSSRSRSR